MTVENGESALLYFKWFSFYLVGLKFFSKLTAHTAVLGSYQYLQTFYLIEGVFARCCV